MKTNRESARRPLAAVVLAAVVGSVASAGVPAERQAVSAPIVGADHDGRPITFTRRSSESPSSSYIEEVALRLASSTRRPLGLEIVMEQSQRQGVVPRRTGDSQQVDLSGLTLPAALDQLTAPAVGLARRYAVSAKSGVTHIAPLGAHSFLDRIVPVFALQNNNVRESIIAVHHLLDDSYPTRDRGDLFSGGDPTGKEELLNRPTFSLTMRAASVREILDAIIQAHRDASWIVRYQSDAGDYLGSQIAVASFEGFTSTFPARRKSKGGR